ncbi:MAG: hypothetical protein HUU46_09325 [Candidatus Hydrogenedentes bacterium]|nr:hypothetical protein [Candidatus Hydrogenedentota bacterium]
MRRKKPFVARINQVKITRDGETAIVEYRDESTSSVNLHIGPELPETSDQDVLDSLNDMIRAQQQKPAPCDYVAVEIPEGSPQIEFCAQRRHWVPRGDVLRCVVNDGGLDGEATVYIDERELSLHDFGRILATRAGFGMRITFVPDDRLTETPNIEVRDPAKSETR